ncbi:dienelactone hydrolase family protein [uncultured Boseongicola sp.]|jgi:phospholipase/carboxylesterase|uniref:alpha/beta hydrolase n=1 Tax=uncultured Boseongicola sp. TaxID=1648499 RepID=UPI002608108E|nr:dienelactone hydrolase family protein [uncultured Boseongicola sp.]
MSEDLDFQRRASTSGEDSSVVMFLHGYGADGNDLLGLAEPLAPHMPDTVFIAPNAPDRSMANPLGFQWFPIPWIDGSSESAAGEGLLQAARRLDTFIDKVLADEGLSPDRLLLFGFSQGTMIGLHVAPRRADPLAGIVGFSGRLMIPDALATEALSRPPVLLVHGDADDVVPFDDMQTASDALQEADFDVYGHVMKGTGHGIAPDGLGVALTFMKNFLGIE